MVFGDQTLAVGSATQAHLCTSLCQGPGKTGASACLRGHMPTHTGIYPHGILMHLLQVDFRSVSHHSSGMDNLWWGCLTVLTEVKKWIEWVDFTSPWPRSHAWARWQSCVKRKHSSHTCASKESRVSEKKGPHPETINHTRDQQKQLLSVKPYADSGNFPIFCVNFRQSSTPLPVAVMWGGLLLCAHPSWRWMRYLFAPRLCLAASLKT